MPVKVSNWPYEASADLLLLSLSQVQEVRHFSSLGHVLLLKYVQGPNSNFPTPNDVNFTGLDAQAWNGVGPKSLAISSDAATV